MPAKTLQGAVKLSILGWKNTAAKREGVRGIDGETEKEKIACARERGREKETILFVLWSKHAPGFMKGVKSWRLIEKWDKQRLWKAEGKIVAGSAGGPPLNLLQTVQPW